MSVHLWWGLSKVRTTSAHLCGASQNKYSECAPVWGLSKNLKNQK